MKKSITIVLIAITFFSGKSIAQFNTVWTSNYQHTLTNGFSNESRKVVTDPSGNSYVLADVTSNKDPNGIITTQTFHYTVLSKYSPAGALLLSTQVKVYNHVVNAFDNDGAFGLKIDASNNIYIGYILGYTTSNFDVCLAKYNSSLSLQWVRTYNPTSNDIGVDMAVTGGIIYAIVKSVSGANTTYSIIKGNSTSNSDTVLHSFTANTEVLNAMTMSGGLIFATGYRLVSGVKSVLTVKVNNQGSLKWTNVFNGGSVTGDDFGNDIAVSPDGSVYVTGTSNRGAPTGNDVLILKVFSGGATAWSSYRDFNNSPDEGLFIEAIDINWVYVASNSYYHIVLDQVEANFGIHGGRTDYYPVPLSPYQYLNGATLTDFKVSPNYGFYLTGSTTAVDASNRVFSASYLVKFVFAGPVYKGAFEVDAEEPINGDFNSSRSGASLALNFFNSDVNWLEDVVENNANHNIEKVAVSDINMVGVIRAQSAGSTIEGNADNILISPNPSNSFISVSANEKMSKLELFDITGQNVKTFTAASEMIKIDMSDLRKGIYIGRIYMESGNVSTRKIIRN